MPSAGAASTGAGTEDDMISAMFQAQGEQWNQTQEAMAKAAPVYYNRSGFQTSVPDHPPPPGYMCYRCGQKGHWIQACPTNNDPNWENKRVRRTTGIPRSMLKTVAKPQDEDSGTYMINDDGEYVVAVADSAAWNRIQERRKAGDKGGDERPSDPELEDPISHRLFVKPVKTPCCKKTYSEASIQQALLDSDFVCPNCKTEDVLLDMLVPDEEMEKRVEEYMKGHDENGGAKDDGDVKKEDGEDVKMEDGQNEEDKKENGSGDAADGQNNGDAQQPQAAPLPMPQMPLPIPPPFLMPFAPALMQQMQQQMSQGAAAGGAARASPGVSGDERGRSASREPRDGGPDTGDKQYSRTPSPSPDRYSRSPSSRPRRYSRSPSPRPRRYSRSPPPRPRRSSSPRPRRYSRSPSPRPRRYSRSPSPPPRRYTRSPSPRPRDSARNRTRSPPRQAARKQTRSRSPPRKRYPESDVEDDDDLIRRDGPADRQRDGGRDGGRDGSDRSRRRRGGRRRGGRGARGRNGSGENDSSRNEKPNTGNDRPRPAKDAPDRRPPVSEGALSLQQRLDMPLSSSSSRTGGGSSGGGRRRRRR